MPKQLFKIDQFHGGLNNNSDARDIAENELSAATDVMVDEVGKIKMMGGIGTQGATAQTHTINPGYGLHLFSHDQVGMDLFQAEHLDETDFASHSEWDVSGKAVDSGGNCTWTFGSGSIVGTLTQVSGDRVLTGAPNVLYKFTYEISVTTAPNYMTLTLSGFSAANVPLAFTAGTHTVTFLSHGSAAARDFVITTADDIGGTTSQGVFAIDNVSLKLIDESGDDYIAFADADTTGVVNLYSSKTALDSDVITGFTNEGITGEGWKPTFYNIDGGLRVCDAEFNSINVSKIYHYVNRVHFPGETSEATYNTFNLTDAEIASPGGLSSLTSELRQGTGLFSIKTEGVHGVTTGGSTTELVDSGAFSDYTTSNFYDATVGDIGPGGSWEYVAVNRDDNVSALVSSYYNDASTLTTGAAATTWAGGKEFVIYPPAGGGFGVFIEAISSGSSDWESDTYAIASTFIYDGAIGSSTAQESLPVNISGGESRYFTADGSNYPRVTVLATSPYNPRITGGRIYYRERNSTDSWKLLIEVSLYNGGRTLVGGSSVDWKAWVTEIGVPQCLFIEDVSAVKQDLINTYELLSGNSSDLGSITARYKTAIIANRMAYIGNVKIRNADNKDVVMGDAMIKSPVNKFDIFSTARIIEASVQDGDEIVKLEEYADRILQFKKKKMHLINVSQEIEFLEETFIHKGVSHPDATCKTDYGIAWVNKHGCYLYDGEKVTNLLERKGARLISSDDWDSFTTANSTIGYVPHKREIIVLKDCTATSVGDIHLYDIITQSWVEGDSKIIDSQIKTNFINDGDGNLVCAHTSGTGTVVKWEDASTSSSSLSIVTKDIDFGQPGQRKKIYKVIVTYKGATDTNVDVFFDVDGGTSLNKTFRDGTNFTSNQLNGSASWAVAELKPTTSSEANSKKSFRLKFVSNGLTPSDFEINDISVVFRNKSVK